jgi:exodeoxyribonuclease VII large subunit
MPDLSEKLRAVTEARHRLRACVHRRLDHEYQLMAGLPQRLRGSVQRLVDGGWHDAERAREQLRGRLAALLQLAEAENAQLLARVVSLSPQAVLDRGYALLSDTNGMLVRRRDQVASGERLLARVADGEFAVRVEPLT